MACLLKNVKGVRDNTGYCVVVILVVVIKRFCLPPIQGKFIMGVGQGAMWSWEYK